MLWKKYVQDGSFLWFGLVLLIALCIAFLLPVVPEDYWWFVRVGEQTLATGAIPTTDSFTYSIFGQAIYYHSWGASVLFWLLYHWGGLTLTVLLRGLIVAVTYTFVWFTARQVGAGRVGAALVTLLAVLASCNNWSIRPQLLTYPLFAAAIWILYRWQTGRTKAVWALPVLALLWGNLHASFVILLALIAAALVFGSGDRKQLLWVTLAVLAALLVNPRGGHTYEYIVQLLVSPSNQQFSQEWSPPVNQGWQMNLFFLWLLLYPLLAVFSPKKLSALEWCWFTGFGFLALWGLRYGIWFILILTVLTAQMLAPWEEKYWPSSRAENFTLNLALPLLFIASTLAFLPGLREKWWPQAPAVTANTPEAAVTWLEQHPDLPGPLFTEMGMASYLEFALPERPVWIDSRVFPFPTAMWQDYREITTVAWDWQTALDRTGANLLLVSTAEQPKLIIALDQSAQWCRLYADEVAQVYSRGACSR